ncbi:hypothetical protein MBLNU230_g5937t1 [Neophaeotheca triangularis]
MVAQEIPPITKYSPFFHPPTTAEADSLAILHLKRDSLLPVKLRETADDGYAEGAVTNTRFGSFPHTTIIGQQWGSQVRASKVDTGTRGRTGKHVGASKQATAGAKDETADETVETGAEGNKRKSEDGENAAGSPVKRRKQAVPEGGEAAPTKRPVEAGSGFVHLLPPTPEAWTESLDHRTQVVYMPDYSYVLQRLRVRPGSRIIEAGAGSGSFTHAAARAVFSGYPASETTDPPHSDQTGRIYSFEYHEPRVHTLSKEIDDHGLKGLVHLAHRDVCNDGFGVEDSASAKVSAIFLDLPAPWTALRHLTRSTPDVPLDPELPIQLCTFSPCIEQVQATVSHLYKAGWIDIQVVEVQHKRLDVRRERVGLKEEGLRGVNASAATVDEAVQRLREVEANQSNFHANNARRRDMKNQQSDSGKQNGGTRKGQSKQARLDGIKKDVESRKLYKEGNLVTRTEPEVKTHTSYLVFAILPKEWSAEEEEVCMKQWPVDEIMAAPVVPSKGDGKTK